MKPQETNPSSPTDAGVAATPVDEELDDDTGSVGRVPFAVSEGDFSTPIRRKRTITRPRGLKTLESLVETSGSGRGSDGDGVAPSATVESRPGQYADPHREAGPPGEVAAPSVQESADWVAAVGETTGESAEPGASAVDEFLSAPPTPAPEVDFTPAPDLSPPPIADGEAAFAAAPPIIENAASGVEMRAEALARQGERPAIEIPTPGLSPAPSGSFAPTLDQLALDEAIVDDLLQRASEQLGFSSEVSESSLDGAPASFATPTVGDESLRPPPVAPFEERIEPPRLAEEIEPEPEPPKAAADEVPGLPAVALDPDLSPLAQALANMAETLHGDLATDADGGIDIDIVDAPLVSLPAASRAQELPAAAGPKGAGAPPPLPASVTSSLGAAPPEPQAVPIAGGVPEALVERPRRPRRSKPWYEEIFDENYLRTLPFMTAEQTLREVDFIERSLAIPKGGEVLDIACGYGRHAIELVQRGLAVTGLDLSLPLLLRAADESQRRALSVNFVHSDMRSLAFDRQFDGAYCMLTSFGYFDEETNLKVAEGIARALKPGGRLLVDVVNRDYIVGDLPARIWWEGDGCVVLEEVDFNFNTNRILTRRSVVFEDGRQLEQEISVRVYSLNELGRLLRQAGFRVIEVSGSIYTPGSFFGSASRNLVVLVEKRSE